MSEEMSYQEYRKNMEEIILLKNNLVFYLSEKKRLSYEYKKTIKLEKETRDKLINKIPNKF